MHRSVAILLLAAPVLFAGCANAFNIPTLQDLEPGGAYVAYNLQCERGCDQIDRGDLIQEIDGKAIKTGRDFDQANVARGKPVQLKVLKRETKQAVEVTLVAKPKTNLKPLKDVPPLWTVGAEELNLAPKTSRRRLFGHAIPQLMLVNIDGGIVDGRQLHGKKRFLFLWDWGQMEEQQAAAVGMKTLQMAHQDLEAAGFDVLFVQLQFPGGRKRPMNDSDFRRFRQEQGQKDGEGNSLPPLKSYRWPNGTEYNEARILGMEGAFTLLENLGESFAIVIIDSRGIVRWHSEGLNATVNDPKKDLVRISNETTREAIEWAIKNLSGEGSATEPPAAEAPSAEPGPADAPAAEPPASVAPSPAG